MAQVEQGHANPWKTLPLPPLSEMGNHLEVLGQRVDDLNIVLKRSPRRLSGEQTMEDKHGGRTTS